MKHPVRASCKVAFLAATVLLAGCTAPDPSAVSRDDVFDPYEPQNRKTHEFNRSLDRALVRPLGTSYAAVVPGDIQTSVGNFADNLSEPGMAVNHLLQADLKGMVHNTYRFVVNSTLGLGGMFDVAADFGVYADDTDFGETLHAWGAREGAYVELPVFGPSTERDTVGKVVDIFTNPLSYTLPKPEKYYGTAASVASKIGDRGRYAEMVDSILYESADSYAQSRLIYLQNRRFDLGRDQEADYLDPYASAYEDPYAE
ncbi:MlaA family lipoprotein [Thalassovita taeanensis]|uniref:Phospholipid-binding lipoprotein MlaA n=1 Tax=Thalassovita taeanensis TaxID=657014 RepID=A0A1H9IJ78_9RHOB|nr:VacJ family lipoprotein [Thalassovita taeanensis]SEQ74654.1 phospholipid-binding lipoprotein MlaA [Thalassovita taeanensis]